MVEVIVVVIFMVNVSTGGVAGECHSLSISFQPLFFCRAATKHHLKLDQRLLIFVLVLF